VDRDQFKAIAAVLRVSPGRRLRGIAASPWLTLF